MQETKGALLLGPSFITVDSTAKLDFSQTYVLKKVSGTGSGTIRSQESRQPQTYIFRRLQLRPLPRVGLFFALTYFGT